MRIFITIFISTLITLNTYAKQPLQSEDPIDAVTDIIKHDDWGCSSKKPILFKIRPTILMKKRFTKKFIQDWTRIAAAAQKSPILDGDILLSSQGLSEISFVSANIKSQTADSAEVEATLSYFADEIEGRPKQSSNMIFNLKKEKGLWKVDDYANPQNISENTTFRKQHQKDK